jgi:anti-anti-sigma regulatory factor
MNNSQITSDTHSPNNLDIFVVHFGQELRTILMNVKIDTKEIFHVITLLDSELTANMSADLEAIIAKKQEDDPKSLILNLSHVLQMDEKIATGLLSLSDKQYQLNKSFVVCNMNETVKAQLSEWEIVEKLNTTPTESEAWDIVQMEEIERELDAEFPE